MPRSAVIDANIVAAYFCESVQGLVSTLTGSTIPLFEALGSELTVSLDSGGHIQAEWQALVQPEWFEPWLASLFQSGLAELVDPNTCRDLRAKLRQYGFPVDTVDFWYIRVARKAASDYGAALVVTEDLHFYDPQSTAHGRHRRRILLESRGRVAVYLRRREDIYVRAVAKCLDPCSVG